MLTRLHIRNFALISEMEVDLGQGLTVITGETGAGKSILLDAVGLLLGEQVESVHFRNPQAACMVEMEFQSRDPEVLTKCAEILDDPGMWTLPTPEAVDLILRREISPKRRSRCLINDAAVPLRDLKILASLLLDLSGQEEAVAVDRRDTQLLLLDQMAGSEALRHRYSQAFRAWKLSRKALDSFMLELEQRKRDEERNRYFWEELNQAPLDTWEQLSDLESALAVQENALESGERLRQAESVLDEGRGGPGEAPSVSDTLRTLIQSLGGLEAKDPELGAWADRLRLLLFQASELARDAADLADQRVPDLEAAALMREQLDLLQGLMHKHKTGDLEALRGVRARLGEALGSTPGVDEAKGALEDKESEALETVRRAALRLHLARSSAWVDLADRCHAKLSRLGMEHAQVILRNPLALPWLVATSTNPSPSETGSPALGAGSASWDADHEPDWRDWCPSDALRGMDQPELYFSANPGQEPRTLSQVASGGEKSRLLLALKSLVREEGHTHTRIFDEIDAGISGETALRMGQMLSEMAKNQQIILITHLPQIAALGDHHWHVTKEVENQQTRTALSVLSPKQRQETLARMIGGDRYGKAALQQALDLLDTSSPSK